MESNVLVLPMGWKTRVVNDWLRHGATWVASEHPLAQSTTWSFGKTLGCEVTRCSSPLTDADRVVHLKAFVIIPGNCAAFHLEIA